MIREAEKIVSKGLRLMGNHFELSAVIDRDEAGYGAIDLAIEEIRRIEKLLTTFDPSSQTNLINDNAGESPVQVDREVFDLIARSIKISALTQGAFDITYGSIDKRLWNFDKTMTALPDRDAAMQMVRLINYKNIVLDVKASTVFLREKGMRIGFGGIGKGYAADRAKQIMQRANVKSGIVNAAGDLTVWGTQPNRAAWTIGVADPEKRDLPFASMQLTNASVATSGNYEKFAIIEGVRYSHTIDPKTGLPVRGIKSVTVICESAELADALATPVTVMGVRAGLDMIDQMKGVACIIIDDYDRIYTTKNIKLT